MHRVLSRDMDANVNPADINYYVINLPWEEERRDLMLAQAEKAGLEFHIVKALSGKELSAEERAHYDQETRHRYMLWELTDNEIACALSHRIALKSFLDSGVQYGVILEDDVQIGDHFVRGIREAVEHWRGWEAVKLYTENGELYPVMSKTDAAAAQVAAGVRAVFPRQILWIAAAYMYTRRAAQEVYNSLEHFWRAADAHIGITLLEHRIPTVGVVPSPVTLSTHSEQSTIDDGQARWQNNSSRNLLQYLRYRCHVLQIARGKAAMRKLVRRNLRRVP